MIFFFFFSSRRRHTRSKRDWSSDVCSSDLLPLDKRAVCSLWPFPSPHGAQALPGSLPCGARTFLGTPLQPACRDHHALPPPGTNTTGSGRVRARLARQPPQQAAQAVERHALPEGRRLVGG